MKYGVSASQIHEDLAIIKNLFQEDVVSLKPQRTIEYLQEQLASVKPGLL